MASISITLHPSRVNKNEACADGYSWEESQKNWDAITMNDCINPKPEKPDLGGGG